jgi:hypothetical protein
VATAIADIDDLAQDGPALVAAVHTIVSELVQEFGRPEVLQVRRDGAVMGRYWDRAIFPRVQTWAQDAGVEVVEGT